MGEPFRLYLGEEEGLPVYCEESAGAVIYLPIEKKLVLKSRTGEKNSYSLLKGHVDIVGNFREKTIDAAVREAIEEGGLVNPIMNFNGFLYEVQERKKFPDDISYKTIQYLGFNAEKKGIPNGKRVEDEDGSGSSLVSCFDLQQAFDYAKSRDKEVISEFISWLED
jgi:ADP-ribose pyrophosphatase YjhB (NUDIX family)